MNDVYKRVTVVICTYNRCDSLVQTLTALQVQQISGFNFDILVVDNASTDRTPDVVEKFKNSVVPVHYTREAKQGIANARNRALELVEAPILAFVDDDAIPDPDWLSILLNTFDNTHPQPAAVGGRIWLRWTKRQPDWMPDELLGIYSQLDFGDAVCSVKMLNGANVAFLTDVVRTYKYVTHLGVNGTNQIPGEDAEILQRMLRDGLPIYYQPGAVVWHIVGQYRENRTYLFKRSHGLGRQQALLFIINGWPGRYAIGKRMFHEIVTRRNWWKRILLSLLSGKYFLNMRERTWTQSVLIRFFEFQRQMLVFAVKGASSAKFNN